MILRIVTANGLVNEYDYEAWQTPRLAEVLAHYWRAYRRVTVRSGNTIWIIKP
jgi:hypothetical protein